MTTLITTRTFSPHKVLSPYIFHYSMMKIKAKNYHELQVKTFPFALASISIGLRNSKMKQSNSESKISSIHTSSIFGLFPIVSENYLSPVQENSYAISIILTYLGVNRILGLPLKELYLMNINLENLFGCDLNLLIDQLENQTTDFEMIRCLDNFFLRKLKYSKKVADPIVSRLMPIVNYSDNVNSVQMLANKMNMHVRTLERNFAQNIGLRPKEFLRLARFIRLKHYMTNTPNMHWADLILKCGFYDQAHLDHEINKVTNMPTKDFYQFIQILK